MTRYIFEEVKCRATKSVKCKCGKRVSRSKTFSQTINPFNTRADGQVKLRPDIFPGLKAEAEKWKAKPELCAVCRYGEQES